MDLNWIYDSEGVLQAEDKLWEEFFARKAEMFDALAEAAEEEIRSDLTLPMFDDNGECIAGDCEE